MFRDPPVVLVLLVPQVSVVPSDKWDCAVLKDRVDHLEKTGPPVQEETRVELDLPGNQDHVDHIQYKE